MGGQYSAAASAVFRSGEVEEEEPRRASPIETPDHQLRSPHRRRAVAISERRVVDREFAAEDVQVEVPALLRPAGERAPRLEMTERDDRLLVHEEGIAATVARRDRLQSVGALRLGEGSLLVLRDEAGA